MGLELLLGSSAPDSKAIWADFIETLDKTQVLGVDGELIKYANIAMQSKNVSDSAHQLWEKGIADSFGYFTVKSSASDLYLACFSNCLGWPQCLNGK